jgi:hypothetical protein
LAASRAWEEGGEVFRPFVEVEVEVFFVEVGFFPPSASAASLFKLELRSFRW